MLEGSKDKVLQQAEKLAGNKALEEEAREKFLLKAARQSLLATVLACERSFFAPLAV